MMLPRIQVFYQFVALPCQKITEVAPKHASKPLVMSQRAPKAKTQAVNEMAVYRRSTELDFFFFSVAVVVVVDD